MHPGRVNEFGFPFLLIVSVSRLLLDETNLREVMNVAAAFIDISVPIRLILSLDERIDSAEIRREAGDAPVNLICLQTCTRTSASLFVFQTKYFAHD